MRVCISRIGAPILHLRICPVRSRRYADSVFLTPMGVATVRELMLPSWSLPSARDQPGTPPEAIRAQSTARRLALIQRCMLATVARLSLLGAARTLVVCVACARVFGDLHF